MFFDDEPMGDNAEGGSAADPTPDDDDGGGEGNGDEGVGGDQSM